jgi:undecaprenyl-diphosphatase
MRLLRLPHVGLLAYWLVLLLCLGVFLELAEDVYRQQGFTFDRPILVWLEAHQTPTLTTLMKALSNLGSVEVVGSLTLLLALGLGLRRSWLEVLFLLLATVGTALLNLAAKEFFARSRPHLFPQVVLEQDFSFPSGHAMGNAAFFLTLYLLCRRLAPGLAPWIGGAGLLLTLAIGFSRLYLQVHYPSDVLAGFALGTAWVLGIDWLLHRRQASNT